VVARPFRIEDAACLQGHGTVDAAPKPLVERYSSANGFGWKLHEVIGAQVVSVPLAMPMQHVRDASLRFMALLAAVFAATSLCLNVLLWRLVLRPISRMSQAVDRIDSCSADVARPARSVSDEVTALAMAVGRLCGRTLRSAALVD
jgi:HAMP domain-containing protein